MSGKIWGGGLAPQAPDERRLWSWFKIYCMAVKDPRDYIYNWHHVAKVCCEPQRENCLTGPVTTWQHYQFPLSCYPKLYNEQSATDRAEQVIARRPSCCTYTKYWQLIIDSLAYLRVILGLLHCINWHALLHFSITKVYDIRTAPLTWTFT